MQYFLLFTLITSFLSIGLAFVYVKLRFPYLTLSDFFYSRDFETWLSFIEMVNILMIIPLIRYFRSTDVLVTHDYRFKDFNNSLKSSTWMVYVLSISGFSFIYAVLYFSNIGAQYMPGNDLDLLLNSMAWDGNYFFQLWKENIMYYLLSSIPVIIISMKLLKLKLGKEWKLNSIIDNWKNVVVFIVVKVMIGLLLYEIIQLINDLIIDLIRIPFVEFYIPLVFYMIFSLFSGAMIIMVMGYIAHYAFNSENEVEIQNKKEINFENDLLDQ